MEISQLTHELVLNKINEDTKGKKSLNLKVNEDSSSSEELENDETATLSRKFTKLMKSKFSKGGPPICFKCKR